MANITFPNAPLQSVDISLEWPGQSVFPALYTGDRHVYTRGVGLWMGQIIFPLAGRDDNADAINEIEIFLHQLEGAANTFDVPIPVKQGGRFPDGTDVRVTAVLRTGSTMRLSCSQQTGLKRGDYITIEHRLYQLVSNLAGGVMQVTPYRPIDVTGGAVVEWASPTLRARRVDSSAISNQKDLEWVGPRTLQIVGV